MINIIEEELARNAHSVLAKVKSGVEVVIVDQDHRAVALILPVRRSGRKVSECIELAKAYEAKLGYR